MDLITPWIVAYAVAVVASAIAIFIKVQVFYQQLRCATSLITSLCASVKPDRLSNTTLHFCCVNCTTGCRSRYRRRYLETEEITSSFGDEIDMDDSADHTTSSKRCMCSQHATVHVVCKQGHLLACRGKLLLHENRLVKTSRQVHRSARYSACA